MQARPPDKMNKGLGSRADQALVILGAIMLQGVVIFLLAGNVESDDAFAAAAGNPLARASWYPLYLALIGAILLRWRQMAGALLPAFPLVLLLSWTVLSLLWSINPDISTRRIIATAFTVLFGVYLAMRGNWIETLRLLGAAVGFVAIVHVVTVVLFPGTGVDQGIHAGAWKGITPEKNALGGEMARAGLLLLALVHVDSANRFKWLALFVLAYSLVIGSTSTTALVALTLPAGAFLLFLAGRSSRVAGLAALYFALLAGGGALAAITLFPAEIVALLGKDPTLTGRTDIWEAVGAAIMQRPWTGYGLGTFWIDPYGPSYAVRTAAEWLVPSAHNAWLEMGLDLGLPGIAMLALAVGWSLARGVARIFNQQNPWMFLGIGQLVIFSLSESVVLWHPNLFVCSLFVFYAVLAMRGREATDLTLQPRMVERPAPRLARAA